MDDQAGNRVEGSLDVRHFVGQIRIQFAALAAKSDDEKMINALRKSWAKMTEAARAEALKLNFGEREKSLIARALAG